MQYIQRVLSLTQFRDIDFGSTSSKLSSAINVHTLTPTEGVLPYNHEKLGRLHELCGSTRQLLSGYLDANKAARRKLGERVRSAINELLSLTGEINVIGETLYDPAIFPKKYWPILNRAKYAKVNYSHSWYLFDLYDDKGKMMSTLYFEEGSLPKFRAITKDKGITNPEEILRIFKSSCSISDEGEIICL
jgi:hypothetical protein